jgi:hypothetical protein
VLKVDGKISNIMIFLQVKAVNSNKVNIKLNNKIYKINNVHLNHKNYKINNIIKKINKK